MKLIISFFIFFIAVLNLHAQGKFTGYVFDEENVPIENAIVYEIEHKSNQFSNEEGKFTIPFRDIDTVYIHIESLGYTSMDTFMVDTNIVYEFRLKNTIELSSVVISGHTINKRGMASIIPIGNLNNDIVLFGEPDIFKSTQLLSGVNFAIEGTSDYVVRGGNVGENLVLLDGVPVFLSSHLLGFVSPVNSDIVKEIEFYKGGFPAKYSNKLSSILNMVTTPHDDIKLKTHVGIGLLSSSLFHSQKVSKKFSFVSSVRLSYIDLLSNLFSKFSEEEKIITKFNDFFLKGMYKINDRNSLSLSLLKSNDKFSIGREIRSADRYLLAEEINTWNNSLASLGYKYTKSKYSFKLNASYSDYNYEDYYEDVNVSEFDSTSFIYEYSTRNKLYYINSDIEVDLAFFDLNVGSTYSHRKVDLKEDDDSTVDLVSQNNDFFENYISLTLDSDYSSSFIGMHMTMLPQLNFKPYYEPRVYIDYRFLDSKVFASYSLVHQVDHLLSNRTIGNYLKIWVLADGVNLDLAKSHEYSIGYQFSKNRYHVGLELYLKNRSQLVHVQEGDQLFITSRNIDRLLSDGIGKSLGIELDFSMKVSSNIDVSLSYTLSKSSLQFSGLNNGKVFDDYYDRRHNLKIGYKQLLNKKWSINSSFVFLSGTPFTAIESIYPGIGYDPDNIPMGGTGPQLLFQFSSLNNARLPSYHRLDIGFAKKGHFRKKNTKLSFGIYNVYARNNPLFVRFKQDNSSDMPGQIKVSTLKYEIVSYFNFIPYINYKVNINE